MRGGVLAVEVDGAGGRTAADIGAGGAFEHFDGFDIEDIARHRGDIAHPINEDAAGGVRPTHINGVAGRGIAVFAEIEGADTRRIAQGFGERSGALFLDDFLADHLNGLRCIDQVSRGLLAGGCVLLIRRAAVPLDQNMGGAIGGRISHSR